MGRCLTLLLLSTLPIWQAYSQTTAIPPSFEVAEIKPADPNNPMPGKGRMLPGGRLDLPGMTLKRIIMFAYGAREDMISGGPKWAGQDRFDIVAKAPPNASQEVIRPMCQSMLADRFKLAIHREDKVQSAYVLTLGKRPANTSKATVDVRSVLGPTSRGGCAAANVTTSPWRSSLANYPDGAASESISL
jgi:uncharacterized protein (TIGR03435 family)